LETRDRILEVLKKQFNIADVSGLGLSFEELRMGSIEEWDSLGNLNLLLEIENVFSVRLTTEELSSIESLLQVEKYLSEHGALR
jgi:acyl carrier protein